MLVLEAVFIVRLELVASLNVMNINRLIVLFPILLTLPLSIKTIALLYHYGDHYIIEVKVDDIYQYQTKSSSYIGLIAKDIAQEELRIPLQHFYSDQEVQSKYKSGQSYKFKFIDYKIFTGGQINYLPLDYSMQSIVKRSVLFTIIAIVFSSVLYRFLWRM